MERKVYPTGSNGALSLPKELLEALQVGEGERIVVEVDAERRRLIISPAPSEPEAQAQADKSQLTSELGRRLHALRAKIVAGDADLLDWERLEQETANRRGER